MHCDFCRVVRRLTNGGTGAPLTQIINLPFACDPEFYCEPENELGWRVDVETHPDPEMQEISVPEVYLCMQLLKLGEKKLKRIAPSICVKTAKKNYTTTKSI